MSSQSNAPQAARRGRHRLRARWGLLVAALAWNCGPVARREEIITVEGDLAYVRADDTDYGCNGEVLRRQKHQGIGAAAAARYETSGGGLFGMRLRGMVNEVLRTQRVVDGMAQPAKEGGPNYGMFALGFDGGWDWRHLGVSVGFAAAMESEFRSAQVVPYSQLRVGDLSTVWFEATAGTNDPLFYFNIFGVGAGLRLPFGLRGRAGFTYHGKLIADALGDEEGRGAGNLKFAASADDTADPGGYLEVRYVPPGGGLGAELGVMGAESPALRLGVNYTFPVED